MTRLLIAMLFALPASAETVALQGRLTNAGGAVDGTYPMTFRLFAAEVGGPPTFQEVDVGVPVVDGVFSTILGDATPLDVDTFEGDDVWVEVSIGTEPPLARIRVSSVPRAFIAERSHDVACEGCITPEETSFMGCADGSILVRSGGTWGCAPRPDGTLFALSNQTCPAGQVVRGIKGDGTPLCAADKDTTYSGANFATSGNGCPPGLVMTGIDLSGLPTCAADKDTTYSGANFAQSGQACGPGQLVRAINAAGQLVCDADKDTTYSGADFAVANKVCPSGSVLRGTDAAGQPICEANPSYTGANFALSNKSCTPGSVVTGIDASGNPVCAPDKDTTYSGANFALSNKTCGAGQVMKGITTTGDPICVADANTGNNGCYTHWGSWGCAGGYDEVVQGRPGGVEAYEDGGALMGNVECITASATAKQSFTNYNNRLMYSDNEGDGMVKVASRCSVCCSGGCYVALGVAGCATGYVPTMTGRTGGVEAYNGNGSYGRTLCVDTSQPTYTWPSGYNSRLMRHRETAGSGVNGMDFVDNVCAVCCRQ